MRRQAQVIKILEFLFTCERRLLLENTKQNKQDIIYIRLQSCDTVFNGSIFTLIVTQISRPIMEFFYVGTAEYT